jgi:hypothetical protein
MSAGSDTGDLIATAGAAEGQRRRAHSAVSFFSTRTMTFCTLGMHVARLVLRSSAALVGGMRAGLRPPRTGLALWCCIQFLSRNEGFL